MSKHFTNDGAEDSAEITTIDGRAKYWAPAVPLAIKSWGKIVCVCGQKFTNQDHYELHYRRAYEEEKMVETTPPRPTNESEEL